MISMLYSSLLAVITNVFLMSGGYRGLKASQTVDDSLRSDKASIISDFKKSIRSILFLHSHYNYPKKMLDPASANLSIA